MEPITQFTDEDIEQYANFLLDCDEEVIPDTPQPTPKRKTPEDEPGPSDAGKCPRYPPQDPSGRILTEEGRAWALRQAQMELHERRRRFMVNQEIMGRVPTRAPAGIVKLDDICFNFFEVVPSTRMVAAMKARFLSKRIKQLITCPMAHTDVESQAQEELSVVSDTLDAGHIILGLWTMLGYCGLGIRKEDPSYDA